MPSPPCPPLLVRPPVRPSARQSTGPPFADLPACLLHVPFTPPRPARLLTGPPLYSCQMPSDPDGCVSPVDWHAGFAPARPESCPPAHSPVCAPVLPLCSPTFLSARQSALLPERPVLSPSPFACWPSRHSHVCQMPFDLDGCVVSHPRLLDRHPPPVLLCLPSSRIIAGEWCMEILGIDGNS